MADEEPSGLTREIEGDKRKEGRPKLPPVDIVAAQNAGQDGALKTPTSVHTPGIGRYETFRDKEKKIGHRRVGEGGQVTYKKIGTSQLMASIQLGIQQAVGSLASKPELDVLIQDFYVVETIFFPSIGSQSTPAHPFSEYKFKVYAPIAFRHFRDLFKIAPDDYLVSLCSEPLRELSNPGASGSIFYLTNDDEFIIKTVQHKEAEFLQKLLPGYYMNLNQNPRTLLPKFFGLYTYQCNAKNIRLITMNNLLPSSIKMHQRYDLKGSTHKRKANKYERNKANATFKDLDFVEQHTEGILLEAETYKALVTTLERDCRVLASFKIMDYSLLVGIHNLDQEAREKAQEKERQVNGGGRDDDWGEGGTASMVTDGASLVRSRSVNRQKLVAHSTAMESIQADSDPIDEEDHVPIGGIPARNAKGERLLLFLGIIDILQSYRLKKKLEHTFKSMIHDGDTISVVKPKFYAKRFLNFMEGTVFKKIPSLDHPEVTGAHRKFRTLVSSYIALRHSPSRRRGPSIRAARPLSQSEGETSEPQDPQEGPLLLSSLKGSSDRSNTEATSTNGLEQKQQKQQSAAASIKAATAEAVVISAPVNLPSVLQDRPISSSRGGAGRGAPPPVPPRSPRIGGSQGSAGATGLARGVSRNVGVVTVNVPGPQPPGTTPPPPWDTAFEAGASSVAVTYSSRHSHVTTVAIQEDRTDVVSVSDVQLEPRVESRSTLSVDSSSHSTPGGGRGSRRTPLPWTPPLSVESSTPTWTEGTPSFTESSSSDDLGFHTTPGQSLNTTRESADQLQFTETEM